MAKYAITGAVTPAQATTISTSTATIGTNYSYSVTGMTPIAEKRLHGVGPAKSAFADSMRTARVTYKNPLAAVMVLGPYDDNYTLFLQNQIIKNELKVIYDEIVLVDEVCINNDYDYALEVYGHLQDLGKTDPAINAFIKNEALTHFAKAEHKLPGLITIVASAKATVNHAHPGKRGTNVGTTVLTFNHKGASVASLITVLPNDSFLIPAGWVDIEVTNLSTTTDGIFSIPTKP